MSAATAPQLDSSQQKLAALEAAFTAKHELWHSMAWQLLGNDAEADDAVQEAMVNAVRHIDSFKGEAKITTWVGKIVINAALYMLRQRAAKMRYEEVELFDVVSDGPSPYQFAVARQRLAKIRRAANSLPRAQRQAVASVALGMTRVEAQQYLGCALKSNLFRARQKMRKALNGR